MNMKWQIAGTAYLWNSVTDYRVSKSIYEFKNIRTEIFYLVLDFNKMRWKFVTTYDNTDMRNWVRYRTNLETWISNKSIDGKSNDRLLNERFEIRITDLFN